MARPRGYSTVSSTRSLIRPPFKVVSIPVRDLYTEMRHSPLCIKLGSVTGLNLAENCREHLPRWLVILLYIMAEDVIAQPATKGIFNSKFNAIADPTTFQSCQYSSKRGLNLAENCREHLPRWLVILLYIMAEAAIIATDIAEAFSHWVGRK
jgi:uncharacterized protein YwlG (UPF0340 family)